jgi:hypothetical protein
MLIILRYCHCLTTVYTAVLFMYAYHAICNVIYQIYYTRKESGTPKVSPKAGNMNAAIFPMDYPQQEPFIGDSTVLVVNDCR